MPGPIGTYIHDLALAATERQNDLGAAAAGRQPDWAIYALGPVPAGRDERRSWERAAGILAGYRELAALPEDQLHLGAEPAREQVLHRALWRHAHRAVATPTEASGSAAITDAELYRTARDWWRVANHGVDQAGADTGVAADPARGRAWRAGAELAGRGQPLTTAAMEAAAAARASDAELDRHPRAEHGVATDAVPNAIAATAAEAGATVESAEEWRARHARIVVKLAAARARLRDRGEQRAGSGGSRFPGLGAGRTDADRDHDAGLDIPATPAEAGFDQGRGHDRDDDLGLGL